MEDYRKVTKLVKFNWKSVEHKLIEFIPIENTMILLDEFKKVATEQGTPKEEIDAVIIECGNVQMIPDTERYMKRITDIIYENSYSDDDVLIDLNNME